MNEEPMYFNRQQLAERAGVCLRSFTTHEKLNVGNLNAAREKVPGIGVVYVAKGCRKYLALCAAASGKAKGRKKTETPASATS